MDHYVVKIIIEVIYILNLYELLSKMHIETISFYIYLLSRKIKNVRNYIILLPNIN